MHTNPNITAVCTKSQLRINAVEFALWSFMYVVVQIPPVTKIVCIYMHNHKMKGSSIISELFKLDYSLKYRYDKSCLFQLVPGIYSAFSVQTL